MSPAYMSPAAVSTRNTQEELKVIMFTDDERYVGVGNITILEKQYLLREENKKNIKLTHLESKMYIGNDKIFYELETIYKDVCTIRIISEENSINYLHLII